MRQPILDMLEFPRQMVRGEMDLFRCPHGGTYDNGDHACRECLEGPECQWLYATDPIAALATRSIAELCQALEFAILSVASHVVNQDHDLRQCACPACDWLRRAEALRARAG